MTQGALHASRPSTLARSSKTRQSTLQSHLNSYIQMCVDHSLCLPLPAIATTSYSSTITHATPLFGSSQIRCPKHAPQPTNHFRPELIPWDTKRNEFGAIMAEENLTTRPSDWCSLLVVQHTNHALPTLTIKVGLPNAWSIPSPRKHDLWWFTPRCHLSFGEKQSILQSTSASKPQTKA